MRRISLRAFLMLLVVCAVLSAFARVFAIYPLAMLPFLILGFFLSFYRAQGLTTEMQVRPFRLSYSSMLIPGVYLVLSVLYVGLVWLIRISPIV